jgi:hypothetical protein
MKLKIERKLFNKLDDLVLPMIGYDPLDLSPEITEKYQAWRNVTAELWVALRKRIKTEDGEL